MSTERWEQVKRILDEALRHAPEQRPAYLASTCGQDAGLREEVESLIASYEEAGSHFLASAAPDVLEIASTPSLPHTQVLKVIGPYRLEEEIGRGGMGQVWRAEQTEPVRRKVALKLIRVGMYDDEMLKRFQAEQQSLAMMDHPSIAKVFDAGATTDGQPYFVMEYVPGVPITDYCDQKRLNIRDRLDLFIKVCEGVQHAHQKAIIHRDLKPANILTREIDGKPVPRIIDFGLAKATGPRIREESIYTRVGSFVGTPGYMSPEQCDPGEEDIDTRSDVYSLGVVLYVLLTGSLPFNDKPGKDGPLEEILRVVREEDPPRPSVKVSTDRGTCSTAAEARRAEPKQLVRLLRGDLDSMTMKALEKDRSRRYGSATELAADIDRYLNHEPVVARPASISYRLSKYFRRHRVGVAIAAGLIILLACFAVMQAVQLRRITRERDRADRITEFMTGIFKVSDPSERVGNSVTARDVLDKAAKDIDTGLSKDPELQARMMHVMGRAYMNLGLYPRAQSLFERSTELGNSAVGQRNRETLRTRQDLGWILFQQGHLAEAESLQRKLLEVQRQALGPADPDTLGTIGNLATTLAERGSLAEAEKLDREVLEKQKRILGPEAFYTLATMDNLAIILAEQGRLAEAEKLEQQTLEIQYRVFGIENLGTINSMINLADFERDLGRDEDAKKLLRQALDIEGRLLGPDQTETAETNYDLACVLAKDGQGGEALSTLRHAVDHGLPPRIDLNIEKEPYFNSLHGNPQFTALVAHAKERAAAQKEN